MQAGLGALARRIEPRQIGAAGQIHHDAAAGVMLRGHHRHRLARHVDAQALELLVDVGEVAADELGRLVRNVEVDEIEAGPLDLGIDRARDDIARGRAPAGRRKRA